MNAARARQRRRTDTDRNRRSRPPMTQAPEVTGFYEKRTGSVQYVVADKATGKCAIIDPVLDYDEKSGATATIQADRILKFIADKGYEVQWIRDTHPHADHFTAADDLKRKTGAPPALRHPVAEVPQRWAGSHHRPGAPVRGPAWHR